VYVNLTLAALVTAAVAALVCFYTARRISQPLEEMRAGAEQFARGDFSHRLHVPRSRELAQLAETLNSMARQLDERIRTIERQKSRSQAILSSMVEGVVALDGEQNVLMVNPAACQFFGVSRDWAVGRPIQEVVRNAEMQELVNAVVTHGEPQEGEFSVDNGEARHLHAYATPLQDAADRKLGVLFVLNDVTDLRRLEKIRSDFVANVSHELKTPITSIKGFVETLQDGALEQEGQARRFLDIVARQAERLHAIIDDLLLLSRVEQEQDLQKEPVPGRSVLSEALAVCRPAAEERDIALTVDCPDDLLIPCNAPLLEQAVVNLLDNAIKYSEPGSEVQVSAGRTDSEAVIHVQDHGPGINADDLERLFERFYRVDKARSRKVGGTGLGLSIVKHITHVHGGRVSAESKLGKGSIFTITLPLS
jgi:two-component system phosphate regulon sensor histidine kinase PhoR